MSGQQLRTYVHPALTGTLRAIVNDAGGLRAFLELLRDPAGGLQLLTRAGDPVAELLTVKAGAVALSAGAQAVQVLLVFKSTTPTGAWATTVRFTCGQGTLQRPMDCKRKSLDRALLVGLAPGQLQVQVTCAP